MRLFDDRKRTVRRPKLRNEFSYDFLQKSGAPFVVKFCEMAEQWFYHYPEEHKTELLGRFRSKVEHNHQSAFMELYFHELFRTSGFTCIVHPKLEASTHVPDFRIHDQRKSGCYLELRHVGLKSEANIHLSSLFTQIDEVGLHDYFIMIRTEGHLTRSVKASAVKSFLTRWIHAIRNSGRSISEAHEAEWGDDSFRLFFRAIPKTREGRLTRSRLIGSTMGEAVWMNTSGEVADGLREKSHKYGEFSEPFVIALQSFADHCSMTDVLDALFGREAVQIEWKGCGVPPVQKPFRHPDGFWGTPARPQNQHVSAVIISSSLNPWNLRVEEPFLLHNPWAINPLSAEQWPLRQYQARETGELIETDGITSIEKLFQLPEDWPGNLHFEL